VNTGNNVYIFILKFSVNINFFH